MSCLLGRLGRRLGALRVWSATPAAAAQGARAASSAAAAASTSAVPPAHGRELLSFLLAARAGLLQRSVGPSMPWLAPPLPAALQPLRADSVKRKRKKAMNRHKQRKLRRAQRNKN